MKIKITLYFLALFLIFSCNSDTIFDGYTDKISYLPTDTIEVFLKTKIPSAVNVPLYDINGNEVDNIEVEVDEQPKIDSNTWYREGFKYTKSGDFSPFRLSSGVYYFENSSPFIVKNPAKKNDVLIVYPSNTDNAYNKNGGRSSYTKPKGDTLSFKRPFKIQRFLVDFLQWIPNQEFNVDYICDRDLEDYGNIENYKVIIIPGHNEYWTRKARRNFDKFVDNGGDAIILSGNTMWWQVRYNEDKMICMKSLSRDSLVADSLKTHVWPDSSLQYPVISSIGANFTHGGFGINEDKGWDGYKILNPSPLFSNTGIKVGDALHIPSSEYDGIPLLFKNEIPLIDTSKVNFYKQVLLGYDKGFRSVETYGTFIVFQKTETSGVIINTASTNWCSDGFSGKDGEKIKKLTYNFIDFLLRGESVF